MDNYIQMHLII